MKILYVAGRWDPNDHNQASGTDYEICKALKNEGAEVEITGPFLFPFSRFERVLREIYKRLFKKILFKYPITYFQKSAAVINKVINNNDYDLIVSFYSAPLVFVKISQPFLYICDSTAKWVQKNWKYRAWVTYETMYRWEKHVIKKATHIITFSKASAQTIQGKYQVPELQTDVFPIPASIPQEIIPEKLPGKKELSPLNLLLVGRDYKRKGIDIAIKINNILRLRGIDSRLRIVGVEGSDSEGVQFMGSYNKTIPSELNEYVKNYHWANFLLHPARFEAAGIVPSEAAAFGVPTLTNKAGGLDTTVQNGVSGIVLPKSSPPEDYAQIIIDLISDPDRYYTLMKTSMERYRTELNWGVLGKKIYNIASNLTGK